LIRARLALLLLGGFALALAGWSADAAYFGPAQTAADQVANSRATLLELSKRQAEVARSLKRHSPSVPPMASLADMSTGGAQAAAAQFQEQTRAAIETTGGLALSSQVAIFALEGGHTKISLLLRARFDELGLLNFLRERESAKPVVLVDNLEVRPLPPLPGESRPLDLTATLTKFHSDDAAP
jgi:hypothetical protein